MDKSYKVIVVGANGYIGEALFAEAVKHTKAYGTSSSLKGDFLHLNLENAEDFNYEIICNGDIVFFTAAISAPDICANEFERAWSVNVSGSIHFIDEVIARGGRCIFFSSDTVYGECGNLFEESQTTNPAGQYAEMKNEVEKRFFNNASFKSIRLSYVFSYKDKFSRYLAGCVQRNVTAEIFHPFYRSIIHLDDVVLAALALANRWFQISASVINFGGPQVLSRIDFAESMREAYFHNLKFTVIEPNSEFFENRPRVIAMSSPILPKLLDRQPKSISVAAIHEFMSRSHT